MTCFACLGHYVRWTVWDSSTKWPSGCCGNRSRRARTGENPSTRRRRQGCRGAVARLGSEPVVRIPPLQDAPLHDGAFPRLDDCPGRGFRGPVTVKEADAGFS